MDVDQCREDDGVGTTEGKPKLDGATSSPTKKQGEERRGGNKPPVASGLSLSGPMQVSEAVGAGGRGRG